jgi:hypothetical protein
MIVYLETKIFPELTKMYSADGKPEFITLPGSLDNKYKLVNKQLEIIGIRGRNQREKPVINKI